MIKPNELRIGNIIGWRDGFNGLIIGKAYEVHGDKIAISPAVKEGEEGGQGFMRIAGVEPVPITPEWLERMGFVKDMGGGGGLLEFENGFICFYDMSKPLVAYTDEMVVGAPMPHLMYVHQLQNLYFSLTGEELTIKETV